MPTELHEQIVSSEGRPVRVLRGGTGPTVVLLHGGWTGNALYCGAADLWAPLAAQLLPGHDVIALDLPGNGGSPVDALADLTVEALGRTVLDVLATLGITAAHLVGHAEGGLLALLLADAPAVRSVTLVQATAAAPTGDSVQDVTLMHPPRPLFSAASQAWVLDRLSATPHHLPSVLDALVAHGEGPAHTGATALLSGPDDLARHVDLGVARRQAFATARDRGFPVPIALVWAMADPLSGAEFGVGTLDYLRAAAPEVGLTLVPRCGHFPFREEPAAVARVVAALVARS